MVGNTLLMVRRTSRLLDWPWRQGKTFGPWNAAEQLVTVGLAGHSQARSGILRVLFLVVGSYVATRPHRRFGGSKRAVE